VPKRKAAAVGLSVPKLLETNAAHWVAPSDSILSPHGPGLDITIGVMLKSQVNGWSNNWRASHGRSQRLRVLTMHTLACVDIEMVIRHLGGPPNSIRFVRLAPRSLDDDNLRTAFKPIRDQVCCWLACDNSPTARANDGKRSGYAFDYGQQQQKLYGIRIEIRRDDLEAHRSGKP
jgi:hypothetical protein